MLHGDDLCNIFVAQAYNSVQWNLWQLIYKSQITFHVFNTEYSVVFFLTGNFIF